MFNRFNVEKKWYTFTDKIMSVSGELFVENDVDISGNLTLKGSLGILDNSTNDISYGNVGSVLTSNGFGNPLLWKEPVYYSAYLNTSINYTTNNYSQETDITNLTLDVTSGHSFINTNTGIFTAPRNGVYNVSYTVCVEDPEANPRSLNVVKLYLNIKRTSDSIFSKYMTSEYSDVGAETKHIQMNISTLINLNINDQIKNSVQAWPQNGPGYNIFGGIPRITYQSIHCIN